MKFILCSVGTGQICILRNISGFFMQAKMGCKRLKMEVFGQPVGGVVADTGSTTKDITVNEGSTLESALKDLKFTSNGAKSDADPVSTNYYPANARDIATGSGNTFIIDASGNLWACGRNNYGMLGDKNSESSYPGTIILTSSIFATQ